jgi:A118 family predicted phage portal protein
MNDTRRQEIKKLFDIDVIVDDEMSTAIDNWDNIYLNNPSWKNSVPYRLSLASQIADEFARLVLLELTSTIRSAKGTPTSANVTRVRAGDIVSEKQEWNNPSDDEDSPAKTEDNPETSKGPNDYSKELPRDSQGDVSLNSLDEPYQQFLSMLRPQFSYALALGGCVFKPYTGADGKTYVTTIPANQFYPISFEPDGTCTAAVFMQDMQKGDKVYTLLEYHNFNREESIEEILYKAYSKDKTMTGDKTTLGVEVNLESIPEWSYLPLRTKVASLARPLFEYFKCPFMNTINPLSNMGVSVYAAAVDLLYNADVLNSLYIEEYISSRKRIGIPGATLTKDNSGAYILPKQLQGGLFAPQEELKEWQVWAPTIQDESIYRGLDNTLRKVEFACGLSYNTLSDANQKELTATEVMSSKQKSHATKHELQTALKKSLTGVAEIMSILEGVPFDESDITFDWDDSIIPDIEVEKNIFMREVAAGLKEKWEYRVKFCDETEEEAKAFFAEMDKETQTKQDEFFNEDGKDEEEEENSDKIDKDEVKEEKDDEEE